MKINHAWKQKPVPGGQKAKTPKYIPLELHEAILNMTQKETYDYASQVVTEMAMLALAEGFGFGQKRITEFLVCLEREKARFTRNVEWEYKAETMDLKFREREQKPLDMTYTLEQIDRRMERIVPEGTFQPWRERYARFAEGGLL